MTRNILTIFITGIDVEHEFSKSECVISLIHAQLKSDTFYEIMIQKLYNSTWDFFDCKIEEKWKQESR